MREIKFRAWDNNKKKMIFGPSDGNNSSSWVFTMYESCKDFNFVDVFLMQYTGLKDKNGVEIYDGDIVMATVTIEVLKGEDFSYYTHDENGVRKIMNCKLKPCVVRCNESGYYFEYKSGETQSFWICHKHISEENEVIGNIHQHKHLLDK